jgi:hypothetical protein
VTRLDEISTGLRLAYLFLRYTHLCIFIDLSWHVVCFSRGFLPRFWHLVHISSHPMIFIVSSIILLSLCAFRILEYLLGYFLEILSMKIIFCLCAGLIFYALWIAALLIFLFGIHLTAVLNTTLFLELTDLMVFLKVFLVGFDSGIWHPAAPSTMFDRCILWKTDYYWSRMFNFQKSWDLILGEFMFLSFGPLANFSLFSYSFGF